MIRLDVRTESHCAFIDITRGVQSAVDSLDVTNGAVQVFVPHTTAGVTINENADPDVPRDILARLEALIPHHGDYRHGEGNSDAHIKVLLTGSSVLVPVEGGQLVLGTWQSVFFTEYDGPRNRKVLVNRVS